MKDYLDRVWKSWCTERQCPLLLLACLEHNKELLPENKEFAHFNTTETGRAVWDTLSRCYVVITC